MPVSSKLEEMILFIRDSPDGVSWSELRKFYTDSMLSQHLRKLQHAKIVQKGIVSRKYKLTLAGKVFANKIEKLR